MGLLDEAIREHLELRRRRGADPGTVAREEHDAFGPVRDADAFESVRDAPADEHGHGADTDPSDLDAYELAADRGGAHDGDAYDGGDFSHIGQETVELDMSSVLDEPYDRDAAKPFAAGRPIEAELDGGSPFEREHADEQAAGQPNDPPPVPLDQDQLWMEEPAPRDFDFGA